MRDTLQASHVNVENAEVMAVVQDETSPRMAMGG